MVAFKLLGSAALWWKIMDFNPEIVDPFSIPVGATIRVPSV
jgi:prophage DNA circulation protein